MNIRYALLAACWLLVPFLTHAQFISCPAPANIKVAQLTATSATLSFEGGSYTRSLLGNYSYPGSTKLSFTRQGLDALLLSNLPPATLITVTLYFRCLSQIPEIHDANSSTVTFTFTTPTALATRDAAVLAALALVPNPAHTTVTLHLPLVPAATQATLRLTDALGRLVRTDLAPLGHPYELPVTGLGSGVYFVQVQAGEVWAVRRLVVQ